MINMDKKSIKKVITFIGFTFLIFGLMVVADYFALFGTKTSVKLGFVEARFRTVDAVTGDLVMDVGVRCFQKHNNNACTRRDSHRVGVVSVNIPVQSVIKSTFLFKKSEKIIKSADPTIHIMLIHQNYNNPTETLLLDDLYANKVNEYMVEMSPRKWEGVEEENNE